MIKDSCLRWHKTRALGRLAGLLASLLLWAPLLRAEEPAAAPAPIALEFGGYRFGQSPSANMTCLSGFCRSQAPDGDGRVTFPFSVYETPGAVSTLAGLTVANPRYTFWDNRLYRIAFQVDCTPLAQQECLEDIATALDREYGLTPLSSVETRQFVLGRHVIVKEFLTESGAFIKVRAATLADGPQLPMVDIVDKAMANHVGSSLSPTFKPRRIELPAGVRQP